jgi:hypothetical protein
MKGVDFMSKDIKQFKQHLDEILSNPAGELIFNFEMAWTFQVIKLIRAGYTPEEIEKIKEAALAAYLKKHETTLSKDEAE